MKKILAALASSVLILASATSQVLDKEQMKNTAWAGLGSPIDGDPVFYGFTDTFQARFDRGQFTIEGMLNWSFLANYDYKYDIDNFVFGTSKQVTTFTTPGIASASDVSIETTRPLATVAVRIRAT